MIAVHLLANGIHERSFLLINNLSRSIIWHRSFWLSEWSHWGLEFHLLGCRWIWELSSSDSLWSCRYFMRHAIGIIYSLLWISPELLVCTGGVNWIAGGTMHVSDVTRLAVLVVQSDHFFLLKKSYVISAFRHFIIVWIFKVTLRVC